MRIDPLVVEDQFEGACYGHNPELWFPRTNDEADEAVRICNGCTLREECLAGALHRSEGFGIWGGRTEDERKVLGDGFKPCPCGRSRIQKTHKLCLLCQQARKRKRDSEAQLARRRLAYVDKKKATG